jgi:dCMP deaminase
MKRENFISWDTYFMGVAILSSKRSKDPSTQVGACLVNQKKKIIGIGYNGFPRGIEDDKFPWGKDGSFLETKYAYVVHAEVNAVLNATESLEGATCYVTLFPCNECAKVLIQSGISEVVYVEDRDFEKDVFKASKKMFEAAGVLLRKIPNVSLLLGE